MMDRDYLNSVAEYIINEHTIEQAAQHFQKSPSSIKKYLSKIRDESAPDCDAVIAERLKLAQAKMILAGQKKGGATGKRGKTYDEATAKMYAEAYLSGLSIEQLAQLAQIPKTTLHDMIRGIEDEELQKRINEYIINKKVTITDKINKTEWKR